MRSLFVLVRRIKCDETKPECYRCTSTGRKCDGYEETFDCDRHIVPISECDGSSSSSSSSPECQVLSVFQSAKEQRAFRFFRERTIQQLSGLYYNDNDNFWKGILLQAAFADDGIRAAVVSLGSLHEDYEQSGTMSMGVDSFALKQYNLAIRQHLDSSMVFHKDPYQMDNYVASCMIFVCIELLQGHYMSALSLVKGAVNLFYNCTPDFKRRSAWPLQTFEAMLSRFQAQAVGLIGANAVGEVIPPRLKAATHPTIPAVFSSVAEARDILEFYNHTHTLSRPLDPPPHRALDPAKFEFFRDLVSRWSSAFDGMLETLDRETLERDQQAINVLQIWRVMSDTGEFLGRMR